MAYAQENGAKEFGGLGFCWGAQMVWKLATEGSLKCIAGAHPSFIDVAEAKQADEKGNKTIKDQHSSIHNT